MDIQELHSFKLGDAIKFHKELNPKLWQDEKLDPVVRKQLLKIAEDFIEDLGVTLQVKDITVSGSNAAFTYTPHSDLDLHVVVDMSKLPDSDVYKELFNAKKTLYNEANDIKVRGIPVELYVQDAEQPHVSLGEYSVLNDEWLRIPKKQKANFDQPATREKYRQLARLVNLAMKTKDLARVKKAIDIIRRYRQAGLHDKGEFSPENLAYKAIRKQGGIDKLYNLRDQLHGQSLSIDEAVETKADAIKLINKLKNTSGRSDTKSASFNAKIDELIRQYKISPEDLGMSEPVDPLRAKISAAAHKRQQAADLLKTEWEQFKRSIFSEDIPPPENARKTQIAGTLPTYRKAAELLKKAGAEGRGLDFGAGLGHGTGELGPDADSYEPFPGEDFKPNFVDVTEILDNYYHKIVSLNVLNVVPNAGDERIRDAIVKNIGRILAPGGTAIITTRGRDVLTINGTPGEEPMSMVSKIGTYQKGFTPRELKEYVQDVLGDGFEVTRIKLGPAGVMIKKKESEKIDEALDSEPYPYQSLKLGDDAQYRFTTKHDLKYEVMINPRGKNIQVSFFLRQYEPELNKHFRTMEITKTGDARRVFATVIDIVKKYAAKNQPEKIIFTAAEPSRMRLYDAFLKRADREIPGYQAAEKLPGHAAWYVLERKPEKIDEATVINEYRHRMYQYIKSVLPTWPDYVVKDCLYANFARGETYNKEKGWSFATIKKDILMMLKDMGLSIDTKWQLVPDMKFTMDMWEPKTIRRLQARAGGNSKSSDPIVHIPVKDAERHATQARLAQQQGGVRKEPVIIIKTPQGYELLEGWHRTIQHFHMYPNGYTGPAYVAVAQQQQNIEEALDSQPYPYSRTDNSDRSQRYKFVTADNNKYEVALNLDDNTGVAMIGFSLLHHKSDRGNYHYDAGITNTGDARRVFATVIEIIKQFADKYKPQVIAFTADEPSRIRLYDAFMKRLDRALPDYVAADKIPEKEAWYILARKNKKIDEASITLYTDPNYFGADVDDTMLQTLPVVNIPLDQLTGYEPAEKMNSPEARANVKRIIAGLKQGAAIPPILVRRWKGDYQVLDGHHRFYAYKLAKKETIPARIVPDDEIETINESSGDTLSPEEKNNTPWQFAKPKLDYWMLQEAVQEYCKKDGKWFPHRTHGIHQLVSKPEIRESVEDEVKEFWNQMSRLDGRANVELVPGSLASVIQCWTHLYDAVFELRGNLAPKKIANVYYEDGGSIGYIEFEDGSTFPDKTFLERGQGGELDGIVTTFFPSKSSAEYMLDVLHLVVPAGWKISTTNLKESALAEASRQIDEIGFSNAPGSLSLSDEQIISNSTKDGTIGSRPVFLYVSGPNRIYFFTRGSKIDAFVYLHNGYLKGMKNLAVNKGLVYNLFQHIINMKGQEIHLGPSDQLTQDGIEWLLGQTKRQTGFKLHDQRGNPIDPDVLFDEWETARETFTPGSTAVTISESKNSIWVRENENLLMPMDTYGATLVEVSPMHSVVEVPDLIEASGYIPSEKEKNDPRFKTALTVDVHPDTMKKAAKGFGWKISRAGIPPQARPNGKI